VTVLPDGFEYQSRRYRSLSAIAREVTGTRWNGLVFFGLKEAFGSRLRCLGNDRARQRTWRQLDLPAGGRWQGREYERSMRRPRTRSARRASRRPVNHRGA
jgi:hypothetical protein